ncbi:MAG TPA: hypothetical protein VMI56_02905 [Reyranella sp.]|nr:hypothetical protein [Reyranella sp.]
MLRLAVLLVGVAVLVVGIVVASSTSALPAAWFLIVGGAITAGTLLERVFYKPLHGAAPGGGWTKTGERFVDPDSGKMVDVFFNPTTGERKYVAEEPQRAARSP